MLIRLYILLSIVISPFLKGYLYYRLWSGKEEKNRLCERFGQSSLSKEKRQAFRQRNQKLIWLHGVSVGESLSLLSFIRHLKKIYPRAAILMTTGTVTAATLVKKQLPSGAVHQYIPLDVWTWVNRFLRTWKPDVVVITESEIWPNLLMACKKNHVPLYLINARMTEKSFGRWQKKPKMTQTLFSCFHQILTPSMAMMERFQHLLGGTKNSSSPTLSLMPNLKFAASPLSFAEGDIQALKHTWKDRIILAAASTHPGEEEIILDVFKRVLVLYPTALLLLVPRHPKRAMEVSNLLRQRDLSFSMRSKHPIPHHNDHVYMVDTLGDMGLVYALAPLVILGGSFVPHIGGHNPIEPALMKCCVIHGPFMENAADLCEVLKSAMVMSSKDELCEHVCELLGDVSLRECYAQKAYAIVHNQKDTLRQLVQFCDPHLREESPFKNDHHLKDNRCAILDEKENV